MEEKKENIEKTVTMLDLIIDVIDLIEKTPDDTELGNKVRELFNQ